MSPYDTWKLTAPADAQAERDRESERLADAADRDDYLVHNWPKLASLVDWQKRHR